MTQEALSQLASLAEAMVASPSLAPQLLQMAQLAEGTDEWKVARTMAGVADLDPPTDQAIASFAEELKAERVEPKRVAGSLLEWAAENAARRRRIVSVLG